MIGYRTVGIPAAAVLLVAGAHFVAGQSDSPRPPSGVKVTQTSYACPAGNGLTVATGRVSPSTEAAATVLPGKDSAKNLVDTNIWQTAKPGGKAVVIEERGRAPGSVGFFGSIAPKGDGGGLDVGSCTGSVDDSWFLGLGSGAKHFSSVRLTNGSAVPAVVDLDLWSPDGKVDAVDAKGVVIKPFTTRRVHLDDLAAGEPELALRVLRRRGAVSAVVNDESTSVFRGTESVTATAAPRRKQLVGGLVTGAGGRTLALLNPGSTTARVEVEVIDSKTKFKPKGLEAIKVKPGSLRLVEVPSSAGSGRLGLQIRSDVPVAATVRMAPSETDYAYAEAVPPLRGAAIVPIELGKGVKSPDLVLTNPGTKTSVQVAAYDEKMTLLGKLTKTIEGGTTKHVDVSKDLKHKGIAYLVVQSKGDLVAAATYRDGDLITSLALLSAPIEILAPQVRPIDEPGTR